MGDTRKNEHWKRAQTDVGQIGLGPPSMHRDAAMGNEPLLYSYLYSCRRPVGMQKGRLYVH